MRLRLYVGVAKLPRFGLSVSGDSVDLVERPRGGLSLIVADGPGTGQAAKRVSGMVVARTAALLAEGVRDGAAARTAHDLLYASRDGRVSCALTILSADVAEGVLVVTQSGDAPAFAVQRSAQGETRTTRLSDGVTPLGFGRFTRPRVTVLPLQAESLLLAGSDGLLAPERVGMTAGLEERLVTAMAAQDVRAMPSFAETVLDWVVEAGGGRTRDDVTVVALGVGVDPNEWGEAEDAGGVQVVPTGYPASGLSVARTGAGPRTGRLRLTLEMPLPAPPQGG